MRKVDNINFTGIKNASYYYSGGKHHLFTQLTGQDLRDFRRAVKKSAFDFSDYEFPYDRTVVNLKSDNNQLSINDIGVEEIDESLPLFNFAAKLTRRIAKRFDGDVYTGAGKINNDIVVIMNRYFEI